MSDPTFIAAIADGLNDNLATVVATKPRFVKLGLGSGVGIIVKDATKRLVYTFEGDLGDLQHGQGSAYLPPGKGLELRDGKDQEGLEIEIRKSSGNTDRWEIYEVRQAALDSTSGRLPSEQRADRAAQPTMSQLDVLRARPTDPPSLAFVLPGSYAYTDPTTGARRTVYDPVGSVSTEVAALSSGQHQAALLYFDATTGTAKVATATAVTAGGTLPSRNEFADYTFANITVPANAQPSANVYLYYGQTQLVEADYYRRYDPRQLFAPPRDTWASLTTTNNTTTTIASIAVAELSALTIVGEAVATRDDYSAALTATFSYGVRRASGGSTMAIAAATITQSEDSAGSPALSLTISSNNVVIQGTGITAQNWLWRINYRVIKMSS